MVQIVFHDRFFDSTYTTDPAAAPGRLDFMVGVVQENPKFYTMIKPDPASDEDLLRAHTSSHLEKIKADKPLYEIAALSAGGAIMAAEEAYNGNPSFALIRPPGHHASGNACWGFCYFNNMSVSLLKLFADKKIASAFILDFDLHTGDGNINILTNRDDGFEVTILNPESETRSDYIMEVDAFMSRLNDIDIFAASAGFDQGINDWGGLLVKDDYKNLGVLMKQHSQRLCEGRRYAIFEGGYYHPDLGTHMHAFCQGLA